MENNNEFQYTYSAKEQEELKRIRERYSAPAASEENKMEKLRRLDGAATSKATAAALVVGILGALIMGSGMSLAMTELGAAMGMDTTLSMIVGIIIGVAGMIPTAVAYPVYLLTLKRERKKIAPEILRLTDELMK